jgi:hypothetical protein
MTRFVVAHPRAMLAAGVLAVALAAFTLVRWFHVNPDVSSLFPKDDETLKLTRALQGDAGPSRTLFVILRADTPEAIDAALPAAVERLRASEHVARVIATREEFWGGRAEWVRRAPAWFLPEATVAALEKRLTAPERAAQIQSLRRRIAEDPIGGKRLALSDPLGVRWVLAEAEASLGARWPAPMLAGSKYLVFTTPPVAFVRIVGKRDSFDVPFANALVADVRSRLDGLRFELAGGYVSASWNAARMERDMKVQVVISTILVVAFLWVFTRSVVGAHVMILPVGAALACTLAMGTAAVGALTPLAVGVIAVMIGMGIDYPIHVFARYRDERVSLDPRTAMEKALSSLGRPFLGAVATTTAPLLTLLLSGFPGFRQFGGLLAAGIAVSVALSLTALVPMLLGVDRFVRPRTRYEPWVVRLAAKLQSRAVAIAVGVAVIAAWAVVATGDVAIDLDLRNVMAQGDPGVAALERLEGELGFAMTPVIALVDRPVGAAVPGAAAVTGAHELLPAEEMRARVERFRSSTAGWPEQAVTELRAAGFTPEPFRRALSEWATLLEADPPRLESLDEPEFASLRASLRYGDAWVVTIVPKRALWRPAERRAFDAEVRAALGEKTRLYSAYHLPDHSAALLKRDLGRVGWWSLAAVVVMAVLSTGSLRGGLLALVPMVAGVGFVLALCRVFGMPLNFFNFEALPILMGTGIDHGIYFVTHRREHPAEPLADAIRETGPGMWGTMASTLLGFGAIAFSSQPGLATMGLLVVAGMSAAFAATLLLLPALTGGRSNR